MSTWTEDSEELFNDLVSEFGDVLSFNGNQISCIKTPLSIGYEMEISGANRMVDTQIDVLRSEAVRIGLWQSNTQNPANKRPVVTVETQRFQVVKVDDDNNADSAVKLICARLQ